MSLLKLLVVEDDLPTLEMMAEVFASLSTDVRPVSDSEKAAQLVKQERFDGIFLDIEMPKLNGFELAQIIRESSWNQGTPIVIVTGRDERDIMYHSFSVGATFFLQKPVDRQKLGALLRTVRGPLFENRRRYTRVPMQVELTCTVGNRTVNGVTWNLSQGGMQIEVSDLKPADTVALSFKLPKTVTVIEAIATVIWSKDERQGVHFVKMSVAHQEAIREFITSLELSPK